MLVLQRFRDESVMVGDDVEVTVVAILGDRIRLGFSAPKDVTIHRKEVWIKIKDERDAARDHK